MSCGSTCGSDGLYRTIPKTKFIPAANLSELCIKRTIKELDKAILFRVKETKKNQIIYCFMLNDHVPEYAKITEADLLRIYSIKPDIKIYGLHYAYYHLFPDAKEAIKHLKKYYSKNNYHINKEVFKEFKKNIEDYEPDEVSGEDFISLETSETYEERDDVYR